QQAGVEFAGQEAALRNIRVARLRDELQARWRDCRSCLPGLHALSLEVVDSLDSVGSDTGLAGVSLRPAVIVARQHQVQLVAAVRAIIGGVGAAAGRLEREVEAVAQTVSIDARVGSGPADERIIRRRRAIPLVDAQQLAADAGQITRELIIAAEVADRDVEIAVRPEVQMAANMHNRGRRRLRQIAEQHSRLEPAISLGPQPGDDRPRDTGAQRLHVVDVDVRLAVEIRVERDAEEAPLALIRDVEVSERLRQRLALRSDDADIAGLELGVEEAPVRREGQRRGEDGVRHDNLGTLTGGTAAASGGHKRGQKQEAAGASLAHGASFARSGAYWTVKAACIPSS